jgi:hypothetical protein
VRSEERAATLPGTVPRRRTDFAWVNIVLIGVDGDEAGDRVGVEMHRLEGVKRDTVRLIDMGVDGSPFISNHYTGDPTCRPRNRPFLWCRWRRWRYIFNVSPVHTS